MSSEDDEKRFQISRKNYDRAQPVFTALKARLGEEGVLHPFVYVPADPNMRGQDTYVLITSKDASNGLESLGLKAVDPDAPEETRHKTGDFSKTATMSDQPKYRIKAAALEKALDMESPTRERQ